MAVLEARGVTKNFGGLIAVNGFDFTIDPGIIASLIGPNGAGKTTFFNMVSGLYPPSTGTIYFDRRPPGPPPPPPPPPRRSANTPGGEGGVGGEERGRGGGGGGPGGGGGGGP